MDEADRLILKKFNQERKTIIWDGLWLVAYEVALTLLVLSRLCPITWLCIHTGFCLESSPTKYIPPLYIVLCGIGLLLIMGRFIPFLLSFSLNQAVGPNGKLLRPRWLVGTFTFSSLVTIILLFAALHRWTGISDGSPKEVHGLGYCLYFSVITITTVGYGDYHPISSSPLSLAFTALEALSGYLILGVLVSSFSSMFRAVER